MNNAVLGWKDSLIEMAWITAMSLDGTVEREDPGLRPKAPVLECELVLKPAQAA